MTKAEEDEVRKIMYEELSSFFKHVSTEMAKGDDTSEDNPNRPEALLKLLFLAARERYIKAMRPY
jgi:hypothetical protein